ncbi:LacI family DNA-binding transcriptional regulator [Mucilaginibacter terrae]|uniref:LacI family DNA-binding transcriptional regulator n=1 Tax=Mucilaginibacter terrae TaxID=1955052 RepID=UPI00363391E6
MKKKLSINDIAQQLNVAKSTVSFIINGKAKEKRITDELTQKVLKYIEEKGFKPNQLARSLSTGKTKMICLMVEKISDYFFSHVAYHLEELAYKSGYKIIYCSTDNDTEKTKELINMFRNRHVDGYIITPPPGIENEIRELLQDNLPVVLFDRHFDTLSTDYVMLDNFNSTYEATTNLAVSGYKNIGFVTLASHQNQMLERYSGYTAAINHNDLKSNILQVSFDNDNDANVSEISRYLTEHNEIDALLFATNYLAITGIKAINDLKLSIPENIAVIAFDDHEILVSTILQLVRLPNR